MSCRLAPRRCRAGNAFAFGDRQTANHVVAMSDGVPNPQVAAPFTVEQDREEIVRQHLLHDLRHICKQLIQIERLGLFPGPSALVPARPEPEP